MTDLIAVTLFCLVWPLVLVARFAHWLAKKSEV